MKTNITKAKYIGEIPLGGINVQCAVIEDGDKVIRVLSETGVTKVLGSRSGGSIKAKSELLKVGAHTPVFLASKRLKPYINQDDSDGALKPLTYLVEGKETTGYQAQALPIVCEIWLRAKDASVLQKQQLRRAKKAEILIRSFAKVGIDALVDEATGYQYDRKYNALRTLVQAYIEDDLQKWVKTFPDSFFARLDKIYKNEKTTPRNRPRYYGKFIVKYVYNPIENGFIKSELDKKKYALVPLMYLAERVGTKAQRLLAVFLP